jgi:hypothetical protein
MRGVSDPRYYLPRLVLNEALIKPQDTTLNL